MGKRANAAIEREKRECPSCGTRYAKSKSQCPTCRLYAIADDIVRDQTILLSEVKTRQKNKVSRILTGPWDPCWSMSPSNADGQGIVVTSVTLIGGGPGAGKSTLSLQLADAIAHSAKREVLFIAAEEAEEEVEARFDRLKLRHPDLMRLVPMGVQCDLGETLTKWEPAALVIDSLHEVVPDLEEQVDFCRKLKKYSVGLKCPTFVISQVNKDIDFAGLMKLQHAVDTTLIFTVYEDKVRELRTQKNRNGPDGVMVFFNMTEQGLVHRSEAEDGEEDEDEDEDEDDNG